MNIESCTKQDEQVNCKAEELVLNDCDIPVNCPWGGDLPGDTCPSGWC